MNIQMEKWIYIPLSINALEYKDTHGATHALTNIIEKAQVYSSHGIYIFKASLL